MNNSDNFINKSGSFIHNNEQGANDEIKKGLLDNRKSVNLNNNNEQDANDEIKKSGSFINKSGSFINKSGSFINKREQGLDNEVKKSLLENRKSVSFNNKIEHNLDEEIIKFKSKNEQSLDEEIIKFKSKNEQGANDEIKKSGSFINKSGSFINKSGSFVNKHEHNLDDEIIKFNNRNEHNLDDEVKKSILDNRKRDDLDDMDKNNQISGYNSDFSSLDTEDHSMTQTTNGFQCYTCCKITMGIVITVVTGACSFVIPTLLNKIKDIIYSKLTNTTVI